MSGLGFGAGVTGGTAPAGATATTVTAVTNAVDLIKKVKELGSGDRRTIFELQGTDSWDFTGRQVRIQAQNLTIRGTATTGVLRNVQFAIDLDKADNILIQDLVFRGTGGTQNADRDGITIEVSKPDKNADRSDKKRYMRITQCTFSGYYDIALDTKGGVGKPRLFATIDNCLFFDAIPGLNGPNDSTFVNRGAMNLSAVEKRNADSRYTVTRNVFVNVWRRCPRVAGGNFAHIFNNLLYQWGVTSTGSPDPNNTTWRGIEIGGGDRDPDKSKAVIQANRFIPVAGKTDLNKAVEINKSTKVDLSSGTTLANEFDDTDGKVLAPDPVTGVIAQPAAQSGGSVETLDLADFYSDTPPVADAAGPFDWKALVTTAGAPVSDADVTAARNEVLAKLTAAGR